MKRSILLFILLFLAGPANSEKLRFFEFGFRNPLPDSVNVIAATTDSAVTAQAYAQLALPENERMLFINGELQYGTETNNPIYSWHFVTDSWELAEVAAEVCDGKPSDVENNKQYWIELIGRFCPWTSFLKREIFPLEVREDPKAKIRVYPNPATHMLTVDIDPSIAAGDITIMDALGKTMATYLRDHSIDLSPFPSGLYYIVIHHSKGHSVFKITKN